MHLEIELFTINHGDWIFRYAVTDGRTLCTSTALCRNAHIFQRLQNKTCEGPKPHKTLDINLLI